MNKYTPERITDVYFWKLKDFSWVNKDENDLVFKLKSFVLKWNNSLLIIFKLIYIKMFYTIVTYINVDSLGKTFSCKKNSQIFYNI